MRKGFPVVLVALCVAFVAPPLQAQNAYMGSYQHAVAAVGAYGPQGQGDDYANARRLIHFKKYAEAIPFLDNAHGLHPHDADVLAFLGYAHYMVGDKDLSLAIYQKALTENPDHKLAHLFLGELYLGKNDVAAAQAQLAELARLCPSSCDERDALTKEVASYQPAPPATAQKATN
jgi:tetratricopeptide (TPR) repeat protein